MIGCSIPSTSEGQSTICILRAAKIPVHPGPLSIQFTTRKNPSAPVFPNAASRAFSQTARRAAAESTGVELTSVLSGSCCVEATEPPCHLGVQRFSRAPGTWVTFTLMSPRRKEDDGPGPSRAAREPTSRMNKGKKRAIQEKTWWRCRGEDPSDSLKEQLMGVRKSDIQDHPKPAHNLLPARPGSEQDTGTAAVEASSHLPPRSFDSTSIAGHALRDLQLCWSRGLHPCLP